MRYHSMAMRQKEEHLIVPTIRTERPSVVEHDRLGIFRAPVLVEEPSTLQGGNRCHNESSVEARLSETWNRKSVRSGERSGRGENRASGQLR